jgi:hypothetical protein
MINNMTRETGAPGICKSPSLEHYRTTCYIIADNVMYIAVSQCQC